MSDDGEQRRDEGREEQGRRPDESGRDGEGRGDQGGRGAGAGRRGGRRGGRREQRGGPAEQRDDMTLVVYLARSGVGSRRRCDELVREGKVTIAGAVVTFPREKVAEQAEVAVEGEVVTPREYRYVLVNKPRGVASTRSDPHAERVLVDLVPDGRLLFPVGRLDLDTTGLIILTNDGVLANRLMHPRYGVTKTYSARVRGHASKRALAELRSGIELEDGLTAPAEARLEKQSNKSALVELTIHEGRKRQVRRMLAALGLPVEELHRRRYGPLSDKNLKIGAWRTLTADEVEALRRAAEEVERNLEGDDPGEPIELAAPAGGQAEPSGRGDATAGHHRPSDATAELGTPADVPAEHGAPHDEPAEGEDALGEPVEGEDTGDEPAGGEDAADEPAEPTAPGTGAAESDDDADRDEPPASPAAEGEAG